MEATNKEDTSANYWCEWLQKARGEEKYKLWRERAKRAYKEYLNDDTDGNDEDILNKKKHRLPLFWASICNLVPAYYARNPEPIARRTFDDNDPSARTAAYIYERESKYRLSRYSLDLGMGAAVLDFLLTARATARVFLEEEKAIVSRQALVAYADTGELMNVETGEVVEGQPQQDETGQLFIEIEEEQVIAVHTEIQPVAHDDLLHCPHAKTWQDIEVIAFRLHLSKGEFKKRFGEKLYMEIQYGDKLEEALREDKADKGGLKVWEIWDKQRKQVHYVCESYKEGVLETLDDPYQLKDFFPCAPFIISTKNPKNLFPVPMYTQLSDVIDHVHLIFTRVNKLMKALRRRGIADASMQELVDAVNNANDLELITSPKFQQLVDKKAMGDLIYYLPLQELSAALVEAKQSLADYENMFYQLSGVPDVVRGVTDAQETAASQQMKGNFYNVRTSWDQHQVQEMARWLIEAQCDLAMTRLPDQLLYKEAGLEFMPEADKQYIPAAIELLRDPNNRTVRLDIETDSLTLMATQQKQADRSLVVETVLSGLGHVMQLGQTNPNLLGVGFEMLMMSLRGIDLGKQYEESVQQVTDAIKEAMMQPPPEPPMPPDYESMKLQLAQQKMEMDGIIRMRELDQKEGKLISDNTGSSFKQQLDQAYLMIESQEKSFRQQLDTQAQNFGQMIDAQKLELQTYLGMLSEREKLIEEERLKQQYELAVMKEVNPKQAAESAPQNIIINNPAQPAAPSPIAMAPPAVEPTIEDVVLAAALTDDGSIL